MSHEVECPRYRRDGMVRLCGQQGLNFWPCGIRYQAQAGPVPGGMFANGPCYAGPATQAICRCCNEANKQQTSRSKVGQNVGRATGNVVACFSRSIHMHRSAVKLELMSTAWSTSTRSPIGLAGGCDFAFTGKIRVTLQISGVQKLNVRLARAPRASIEMNMPVLILEF